MATWDGAFWKATFERVIGTAAATAVGVLSVVNVADIDWTVGGISVAVASAVTFLKSIVANASTGTGPGFGSVETLKELK